MSCSTLVHGVRVRSRNETPLHCKASLWMSGISSNSTTILHSEHRSDRSITHRSIVPHLVYSPYRIRLTRLPHIGEVGTTERVRQRELRVGYRRGMLQGGTFIFFFTREFGDEKTVMIHLSESRNFHFRLFFDDSIMIIIDIIWYIYRNI